VPNEGGNAAHDLPKTPVPGAAHRPWAWTQRNRCFHCKMGVAVHSPGVPGVHLNQRVIFFGKEDSPKRPHKVRARAENAVANSMVFSG